MIENRKYNEMFYETGPTSFESVASSKLDNVHKMLYNDALKKYFDEEKAKEHYADCNSFNDFLIRYKFVEIKRDSFSYPSEVIISSKTFPYKQYKVDLADYWNNYQYTEDNKDITDLIKDEEVLKDAKLVYIDYVRNRCKFRSKITGKEFWTTLDYINEDTPIDNEFSLDNTFGGMIKNM